MITEVEPVRVLVIEAADRPAGRLDGLFERAIADGQLKVGFCRGMDEGRHRLVGDRYQVVIVEVHEGASGVRTLQAAHEQRADLPLLALVSGRLEEADAAALRAAGARGCVSRSAVNGRSLAEMVAGLVIQKV